MNRRHELDALELRIEDAWMKLSSNIRRKPVTVYLSDRNAIHGIDTASRGGVEIGTYDSRVTLRDFRDDVFFAHEKRMRRA